jgi:hypothetical protein
MLYEQTVTVPENHRLTLEVPREIPAGAVARFEIEWQTPSSARTGKKTSEDIAREMWESIPTIEECLQEAEAKYTARKASGVDPLLKWRDSLKGEGIFGGIDGLTYQKSMRDEWPD